MRRLPKREVEAARQKAQSLLAPLGGAIEPAKGEFELFVYRAPGVVLVFYPHRTTSGNLHVRVRDRQSTDHDRMLRALARLSSDFPCKQFRYWELQPFRKEPPHA